MKIALVLDETLISLADRHFVHISFSILLQDHVPFQVQDPGC